MYKPSHKWQFTEKKCLNPNLKTKLTLHLFWRMALSGNQSGLYVSNRRFQKPGNRLLTGKALGRVVQSWVKITQG